jgi:K+-sensing histidine kinase KdpD
MCLCRCLICTSLLIIADNCAITAVASKERQEMSRENSIEMDHKTKMVRTVMVMMIVMSIMIMMVMMVMMMMMMMMTIMKVVTIVILVSTSDSHYHYHHHVLHAGTIVFIQSQAQAVG